MHAFILVVTVFLIAQPGAAEHAVAQAAVMPTAEACAAAGRVAASELAQDPKVSVVGFSCFEATDPKSKVA